MKNLLLFFCLVAQVGFSQTHRLDSLKKELGELQKQPDGYAKDTLIYRMIKVVMNDYVDVNLDSSVHYNTLMIKLCRAPTLQKELIYAYQFAGFLYEVKGDHYQSIEFHYKALLLAEKLKQYNRLAMSYGSLAHAYASLKEYSKATVLSKQGLSVLKMHPDARARQSILNVLGSVYRDQGKLKDALKTNQELYELAKANGDEWTESQGLHALGWVYKAMGDMPKALDHFQKALALSRKIGSIDLEGSILLNISDLYIRQSNWQAALRYSRLAKQRALQVNNSSVVVEAEELLYKIYKNTGESAKALKAHENFASLKDSLSKERTKQRIESLQAQYDNVQKENTLQKQQVQLLAQQNQNQQLATTRNGLFLGIAAVLFIAALLFWNNRRLQTKNQEINRQSALLENARKQLAEINKTLETRVEERTLELVNANRELTTKNEEIKEALFKGQTIERKRVAIELHDNLSSLLSAVNMSIQYLNPKNLSESEQSVYQNVKLLIQNAYAEVRNISHNILPAELEKEGLVKTLTALVGKLNQNSPLQFLLTIEHLAERLPIGIEFNVYTIVLELINNVIKHAKATTVGISLCRTESGIHLSVTDNGIGLGQSHDKRGIGLKNIVTRLESLGGTFDTNLPEEKGTRIVIKIPIETIRINEHSSTYKLG
ncbi:tetratricopeptide repeat-containing sensor histidine kinase [Spirosoma endbachense]|uniref:histidine kinase n=1 Tax=Spirosoma endbachense TaxID=2666025 RepID=A0A6P1WA26_9BACT|nr:sensor histidine kinase [Spirosoma endbachense]QHW00597.1 tetratricopeptide repeat protein [Spirosoma endbachense]